jgi:hypothetical protein
MANIATAVGPALATPTPQCPSWRLNNGSNLPLNSIYKGLEGKERGAIMASAVDKSVPNGDGNLTIEKRRAPVMGHDI